LKHEEQNYNEAFVFLISLNKQMVAENENFLNFEWSEVNGLLKDYKEKRRYPFLNEFLEFMGGYEGMNSFSGFEPYEYGPDWEGYAKFRKNAQPIILEMLDKMEERGYIWTSSYNEKYMGTDFRVKGYGWKFYYWIGFIVSDKSVHLGFELNFQKKFREYLRSKHDDETRKTFKKLIKDGFRIEDNQDYAFKSIKLVDLAKRAKSRSMQKKEIFNFIEVALKQVQNSGILNLLQKAEKEF
jgi:hypothetical protein